MLGTNRASRGDPRCTPHPSTLRPLPNSPRESWCPSPPPTCVWAWGFPHALIDPLRTPKIPPPPRPTCARCRCCRRRSQKQQEDPGGLGARPGASWSTPGGPRAHLGGPGSAPGSSRSCTGTACSHPGISRLLFVRPGLCPRLYSGFPITVRVLAPTGRGAGAWRDPGARCRSLYQSVPELNPGACAGPGADPDPSRVLGAAARGRGSHRAPFNGREEELGAFKKVEGGAGKPGMREGKAGGTDGNPRVGETRTPRRSEHRMGVGKPGWREENRDKGRKTRKEKGRGTGIPFPTRIQKPLFKCFPSFHAGSFVDFPMEVIPGGVLEQDRRVEGHNFPRPPPSSSHSQEREESLLRHLPECHESHCGGDTSGTL